MGVSGGGGRSEVIRSGGGKWACLGEEDQAVPGSSWRLLAAPRGSWQFLAAPGGSWRLLGGSWAALGGSWAAPFLGDLKPRSQDPGVGGSGGSQ